MLLVLPSDGIRMCREGTYERIPAWQSPAWLTRPTMLDRTELRRFLGRAISPRIRTSDLGDNEIFSLAIANLQRGDLFLVMEGDGAHGDQGSDTADQRKLIRRIEALTGKRMSLQGRSYKLVAGDDLAKVTDRDRYEVVRQAEAVKILSAVAQQKNTPDALADLLQSAQPKVAPDWRPPLLPDGLVVLRRIAVVQDTRPSPEAPITPSQMKALLKKSEWIEIEVFDDEDRPYTGPYAIELPDGRRLTGVLDKDGFWGNYEIDPGTCKLTLPRAPRPVEDVASDDSDDKAMPGEAPEEPETPPELEDPELPPVDAPDEPEVEFVVKVVDETGHPVPAAPVVFRHASQAHTVPTDATGTARHTGPRTAIVDVGFESPSALSGLMKTGWAACKGIPRDKWEKSDRTTTVLTFAGGKIYKATPHPTDSGLQNLEPLAPIQAAPVLPVRLSVQPLVTVARFLTKHFDLNKSFLLPSGLSSPQEIVRMHREASGADVLLVGHTDTSSTPDYNLDLSVERAAAMRDYLTNHVDGWLAWYGADKPDKKRWGTAEDSAMIANLVGGSGSPATVLGYQQWHNTAAPAASGSETLKPDGIMGQATRRQLILDYMNREGTTLPDGATIEIHGCGEYFPLDGSGTGLDPHAADGQHEPKDRRVEVFFFPSELGILPPVPGPKATKSEREYPEWRARATQVDFVAPVPARPLEIRLVDETDAPLAGMALKFSGAGNAVQTTDASGQAIWPAAVPGRLTMADEKTAAAVLAALDPTSHRTTAFPEPTPTLRLTSPAQLRLGIECTPGDPIHVMVVARSHLTHTVQSTRWTGLTVDGQGPWILDQSKATRLSMVSAEKDAEVTVDKTSDDDLPLDSAAIAWLDSKVEDLHEALYSANFETVYNVLRGIPLVVEPPAPASEWPPEDPAPDGIHPDQIPADLGRGGA